MYGSWLDDIQVPVGESRASVLRWLEQWRVEGAPEQEMRNYLQGDFLRFLRTLQLVPGCAGKLLEIGANPYYMTMLLRRFRPELELTLTNCFMDCPDHRSSQRMVCSSGEQVEFAFDHFNAEKSIFPYDDHSFDVVLLCEVLEHLPMDSLHPLLQIKRVLKPGGTLIVTTPNVSRMENVLRLCDGGNIYDPLSGYGVYGRHNREYNRGELSMLLQHAGFAPIFSATADVHGNFTPRSPAARLVAGLMRFRRHRKLDLGQYLFFTCMSVGEANPKKPGFLYRSYPPEEMA